VPKAHSKCPVCNYYSFGGKTHLSCKSKWQIDGLFSTWKYYGIVRKGVHAFKYRFAYDIASEFIENVDLLIFAKLNNPVLVSIPLHTKRENWRGFNQSDLLSKNVSQKTGLVYAEKLLYRTENTTPQAQLGKLERVQNISGIFAVNRDIYDEYRDFETFILIDDVWTTGSTMKEACKVLKKAGAEVVWGYTLAC
jgi:ComF family protein